MKKKFVCTVCGYVHEGDTPPERCPQCKQPADKFKEVVENGPLSFATEHVIGVAKTILRKDKPFWEKAESTR